MGTAKRILIVDDSSLMLEVSKAALEAAGYDVTVAHGHTEIRSAFDVAFDLILIDVLMPGVEGHELAFMIRRGKASHARIHLVSELDEPTLAERTRWAGADGYFCKRAGVDALVAHVRNAFD
jgi:DNA-binding response OmpR family regulator